MKKLLFILPLALLVNSCIFFKMDNYDGPDASVTGKVIDATTKELVPTECKFSNMFGGMYRGAPTVGYFSVYEQGWDYESAQYWHIKYSGEYSNTQVFAGKYRIAATACNFYPQEQTVEFQKGSNTLDWTVTPYARVKDPKIAVEGGKIVARFKVELGDPAKANKITDAKLCCYLDSFVGYYCNYCANDPGATSKTIVADGVTENVLTIDPSNILNSQEFKYPNVKHYLRIAVQATGNGANTGRYYNFSPTIELTL